MAKVGLRSRLLTTTVVGLLALTVTRDIFYFQRKGKPEISQKIERTEKREYSDDEKAIIESFKKDAFLAGCPIERRQEYVDRMLKDYPSLDPEIREEVKDYVITGLSHLKKFYEKSETPNRFCDYEAIAYDLGLDLE